jgi:hypothetical protein
MIQLNQHSSKNLQVNCRRIQILQSAFGGESSTGASFKDDNPVDNEPSIDDDVPF